MHTKRLIIAVVALFALLAAYSTVLLVAEWNTSQQFVRNYFTDIEGPVPFYAVNTTLSVLLLWTTAVLFLVAAGAARTVARWPRFFISQACIFAFLSIDDRFKFHEWSGRLLDVPDHYILAVIGGVEVGLLVLLGGALFWRSRATILFLAATIFFGVMFAIDAWVPHDMVLRLSLEDLAKTWSAALFCFYAWTVCRCCIERLRNGSPFEDGWLCPDARRC